MGDVNVCTHQKASNLRKLKNDDGKYLRNRFRGKKLIDYLTVICSGGGVSTEIMMMMKAIFHIKICTIIYCVVFLPSFKELFSH
mgnify:CR=1 FL=1